MTKQKDLDSREVQALAKLIEEATRSSASGVKYFLEPAQGVLDRAMAKRHHIVFGRRGSGKSSLLHKIETEAAINRNPVVFVDMEEFKGHSYPDVLVSVLLKIMNGFDEWLSTTAVAPANKANFWRRLFGKTPETKSLNRKEATILRERVGNLSCELNKLLFSASEAVSKLTDEESIERRRKLDVSVSGKVEAMGSGLSSSGALSGSDANTLARSLVQEYTSKKIETLHRMIIEIKRLLSDLSRYAGNQGYVLIDDLYHIRTASQADVIDYLHRVCKGTGIWLKIGTIRHRTRYYLSGDPPRGMKIGDDADDIDLDVTLEKYQLTKRFLFRVLEQFCLEKSIKLNDIITNGARDRLVLASGGVARDFLTSFRRSISIARERIANEENARGPKIGAEDVNVAAGENDANKREEFNADAPTQEQKDLMELFGRIRTHCIDANNSNCFLIDKDYRGSEVEKIGELVDLKFIHHISSRVTVRDRTGRVYDAYMLDLSQYTGERTKRNLDVIEFWDSKMADKLGGVDKVDSQIT
ncbi:MAG: hypothetical protein ACKOED_15710 [Aestuariivirga sp.]|uniref:hypothetical protein n=1 Tax=Aestuariivirga sp. TaxID=2650926 RepID=UPI0038CF57CC